ncbi:MAG: hypothetical protein IKQ31_02160 [Clostridia bacterium]|nr:hypothetical protein [Clostridia bacterium]
MKLLRCYIENYGKLHQFSYDFDPKLNTILKENGWGKTTLSSFIKAMLFGLPVSSKKDLDENERAKYTPWQAGNFGGWLEFELKGKQYRIERFWGEKQSKDKYTLYDLSTNQAIDSPNFVEDSLKINAETFERSTFISHNFSTKIKNDSIKERLSKLLDNVETQSVSKIDDKLKELITSIEHQKGKGGKLWDMTQKRDLLETEIKNCETAHENAEKLSIENENNKQKINQITEQITKLQARLQELNDHRVEQEKQKSIKKSFDEVKNIKAEIESIDKFFKNSPPDSSTLNSVNKAINELKYLESTLENLKKSSVNKEYLDLKQYFKQEITEQELNKIKEKNEKLREISLSNAQSTQKLTKKNILIYGLDILSIILVVMGILGLILSSNPILFAFITIIGFLIGGLSFFFTFKSQNQEITPTQIHNNKVKNQEYTKLKQEIDAFVSKFNEQNSNFDEAIIKIETKFRLLQHYKDNEEKQNNQLGELQRRFDLNQDFLSNYLSQFYTLPINFENAFDDITKKLQKKEILHEQLKTKEATLPSLTNLSNNEIKQNQEIDIKPIQAELIKAEREKEQLTQTNAQLQSKIDFFLEEASKLTKIRLEWDETNEEISSLTHKLNIVKLTQAYIKQASTNLTSKYLSPITTAFKKYAHLLVGNVFDNISIDTDLNIAIENMGEQKNTKFYSLGNRDLIELCMRLALAETLFDGENPPIILDDTFSNLDDEKTQKSLDLLRQISNEFQVLYLVCHSSRAIK